MPKVELKNIVLYYSALSQSIYAGIPDKRSAGKAYSVALHKQNVTNDFWRCLVQRCEEGKDVAELRSEDGELMFEVRVKDMRKSRKTRSSKTSKAS